MVLALLVVAEVAAPASGAVAQAAVAVETGAAAIGAMAVATGAETAESPLSPHAFVKQGDGWRVKIRGFIRFE